MAQTFIFSTQYTSGYTSENLQDCHLNFLGPPRLRLEKLQHPKPVPNPYCVFCLKKDME